MKRVESSSVGKANTLLGLQFLSDFGDQITAALLALCVLDITQSTGKVGLVFIIITVGQVLFTFLGGLIGDKFAKKDILFYADIGRSIAVLLMILSLQQKSIVLIYLTSFLLSILGSLHNPVKLSTWAQNIPINHLQRYNSLAEFSRQSSTILGPLIASFFLLKEWTNLGFMLDSFTFFICAIVFLKIISPEKKAVESKAEKRTFHYLDGFRTIIGQNVLLRYVAYDSIQMIGFGALNATFLTLAQRDYGWSKGEYSIHLTVVAVFTTVGALAGATKWIEKIDSNVHLTACAIISALTAIAAIQVQTFPLSSILMGVCSSFAVLTMPITRTKIQLYSTANFSSRISSILASRVILIKTAVLLGMGGCILIDDFISLKNALILFTIPIALSCLAIINFEQRSTSRRIAMKSIDKA
jgi:MFS transporter, DHA3 family, macrolide efflux protein